MKWLTKNAIRQSLAVAEERLRADEATIIRLQEYIDRIERVIDKERERANDERQRADRLQDAYLQSNGLPATTATVIAEQKVSADIADENFKKIQKELNEIYGESFEELGSSVPNELVDILMPQESNA